jgi:hypothetical protein
VDVLFDDAEFGPVVIENLALDTVLELVTNEVEAQISASAAVQFPATT